MYKWQPMTDRHEMQRIDVIISTWNDKKSHMKSVYKHSCQLGSVIQKKIFETKAFWKLVLETKTGTSGLTLEYNFVIRTQVSKKTITFHHFNSKYTFLIFRLLSRLLSLSRRDYYQNQNLLKKRSKFYILKAQQCLLSL